MIRNLREQGLAIIYISHYLSEITEICDRVTVLRNGQLAGMLPLPETSIEDIVTTMVGREIEEMYPPRDVVIGDPRLEVEDLSLHGAFTDISLAIRRGEVVGVTGLLGSGTHELAETIYGLRRPDSGSISLDGKALGTLTASKAADHGFGMVPKDRRWEGVVLSMSVADNINLSSLEQVRHARGHQQRPLSSVAPATWSTRSASRRRPSRRRSATSAVATSRRPSSRAGCPPTRRSSCSRSQVWAWTSGPRSRSTRSSTRWPQRGRR